MSKNDFLKTVALRAKRRLVGKETAPNTKIKIITNEDEDFKSKVEFLLSQEDVITNPVHYLMDDKILKNMDDKAKERYLLSTIDKYNSFKNQIESSANYSKICM